MFGRGLHRGCGCASAGREGDTGGSREAEGGDGGRRAAGPELASQSGFGGDSAASVRDAEKPRLHLRGVLTALRGTKEMIGKQIPVERRGGSWLR